MLWISSCKLKGCYLIVSSPSDTTGELWPVQGPAGETGRGMGASSPTHLRRQDVFEPLDMSNVSLPHPSVHAPCHVVQSVRRLLCSGGSGASSLTRPSSCDLPRAPSSQSSLSKQSSSVSTQGSMGSLPGLPAAPSSTCPAVPGLTWRKFIGSGSFARIYSGAPSDSCSGLPCHIHRRPALQFLGR